MTSSPSFKLRPLHGGISVPDMQQSIAWYGSMLGFKVVSDEIIPPLKCRVAFLERDGWTLELFEPLEGGNPLPAGRSIPNQDILTHGFKHVAYAVQDLQSVMTELKAKGVDVALDIFPMGAEKVAFIRDNSGILIEFIQQA